MSAVVIVTRTVGVRLFIGQHFDVFVLTYKLDLSKTFKILLLGLHLVKIRQ